MNPSYHSIHLPTVSSQQTVGSYSATDFIAHDAPRNFYWNNFPLNYFTIASGWEEQKQSNITKQSNYNSIFRKLALNTKLLCCGSSTTSVDAVGQNELI